MHLFAQTYSNWCSGVPDSTAPFRYYLFSPCHDTENTEFLPPACLPCYCNHAEAAAAAPTATVNAATRVTRQQAPTLKPPAKPTPTSRHSALPSSHHHHAPINARRKAKASPPSIAAAACLSLARSLTAIPYPSQSQAEAEGPSLAQKKQVTHRQATDTAQDTHTQLQDRTDTRWRWNTSTELGSEHPPPLPYLGETARQQPAGLTHRAQPKGEKLALPSCQQARKAPAFFIATAAALLLLQLKEALPLQLPEVCLLTSTEKTEVTFQTSVRISSGGVLCRLHRSMRACHVQYT
jgi:hypothetical protein